MAAVGGEVKQKQDMQDSEVVAKVESCKKKQNGKVKWKSHCRIQIRGLVKKKPGIRGSTNIAKVKN